MKHNQKNKREPPVPIPPETIEQIINRWKTSKLNTIPDIAIEFKLPVSRINAIINKYLSTKTLP